ncbi:MAG: hypothetical protein ACI9MC_001232, partial [Kiritimatiellia bacterium]
YLGGLQPLTLQLWVDQAPYVVRVELDELTVRDGVSDVADVVVRGSAAFIVALLGAGRRLVDLPVVVEGSSIRVSELQDALLRPSGEGALIGPST